ncbi:hypothetical protein QJS10_CPB19g01850 [Acorus calamus]|uniref:Uncharacterized protein n=1 Tax=Acorus calamus TaxID=4465 RepID=A0AAV9CEV7_ACOCL|nr:hypothetical protein QJS10_CPB19g01850 [Acorus calamus]
MNSGGHNNQMKQRSNVLIPRSSPMTHASHEPHDDKPMDHHGCCGGLSVLHSIAPQSGPPSTPELKQKKEVQRQKDMKIYKGWLERVQDYLRRCLNKAKENGFLDLKNNHHNNPHSESNPQTRPNQLPTLLSNQSLEIIRHQAKINGWYIEPNEEKSKARGNSK